MHIGIDARFYGPIGKGLGRYTAKLIEHLASVSDTHTYTVFLRRENFDAYTPPDERFRKALAPYRWYSVDEQIRFPLQLARAGLDLMHFPHFNVPVLYRRPFVVTIHDLILTRFPTRRATTLGSLAYFIKRNAYQIAISSALRRARHVITVSQYSRQQIMEHFPDTPPERIRVTYEGADDLGKRDAGAVPGNFPQKYFLYVGNAYPHKNLETLLDAFTLYCEDNPDTSLVLVGKQDYFYARLGDYARELGISGRIFFAGYVHDETLAALYAHAIAYVIPSLEEGFGLPPLEAMHYRTPVLAARASCLPEILGTGAEYVDPKDPGAIAQGLRRIAQDTALREELVRNATANVLPRYSWRKMAEETHQIYTAS